MILKLRVITMETDLVIPMVILMLMVIKMGIVMG